MDKNSTSLYYTVRERNNIKTLLKRKSEVLVIYIILIIFFFIASMTSNIFFSYRNLRNILIDSIGLLFVTFAQVIVMTLGGVDLSVGSTISVVNVMAVKLMNDNVNSWIVATILCLFTGIGIGIVNGLLVVKANMQPIIATFATQTIFAGVAILILPSPQGTLPGKICKLVTKGWNNLFPIMLMVIVFVIVWLIMFRTNFGRHICAIGGSENAAEYSGINVDRTKIMAFAFSGLIAAVGGLYISFNATSGNPLIGDSYTQRSITTAVIAGTSLSGGKSSVLGCFAAVIIMGIINNLLNLMHVNSYYKFVIEGIILIVALAISAIRSKK